jgi:hypothetical protein
MINTLPTSFVASSALLTKEYLRFEEDGLIRAGYMSRDEIELLRPRRDGTE